MAALAYAAGLAGAAHADVLAEFLFWDAMGKNAAQGVKSYIEYREQRALWAQNIAKGKAALARCGNCSERAEIEKDLAYWQNTENQFQQFAGATFAAVGMPRVVADWLDIDMPMAPPPSRAEMEERYRVVRPAWFESRPAFCQQAVEAHLQCLRDFQTRTGTPMTGVANNPGGACYDSGKLFERCRAQDYQGFEREKSLQAARAGGKIIPEYVEAGAYKEIYYGRVPDAFVPELPAEVVRKAFEERPAGIRLSTRKSGTGVVGIVTIERFAWQGIAPSSTCFSGQGQKGEIERRVCDDLSTLGFRDRAPLLLCRYTQTGEMPSDPYAGSRFWFESRPATAEPARLLSRSSNHPVLSIGEPRTACPATKREAEQIEARWAAMIRGLRAKTPQTAASIVLPEAEWRQEQREANKLRGEAVQQRRDATERFGFEGVYTFETTFEGAKTSGQCLMSYAGPVKHAYLLQCRHRDGAATGKAVVYTGSLMVDWELDGKRFTVKYEMDESRENTFAGAGLQAGAGPGLLVRTGDLLPLAGFPVTGVYRFERAGNGTAESGQCTITTNDRLRPPPFHFACVSDAGASLSNTAQNDENAIFLSWPPLNDVSMDALVFVREDAGGGGQAAPALVGSNEYGARVRLVRTGDLPAAMTTGVAQASRTGATRASAAASRAQKAVPTRPAVPPATSAQAPAPVARAAGQPCTAEEIAGTYRTGFGPLACKAAGTGLECCYGSRCANTVRLAFDGSGPNMAGTWLYPNGSQGPVIFPVSAVCQLESGRWNYVGRGAPARAWAVAGRQTP